MYTAAQTSTWSPKLCKTHCLIDIFYLMSVGHFKVNTVQSKVPDFHLQLCSRTAILAVVNTVPYLVAWA